MKFLYYLITINVLFSGFNAGAEYRPPLAPPSSLALSMDEMILHFKIFIIADIFKKISRSGSSSEQKFFNLTDIELDVLFRNEMEKQSFIKHNEKLEFFFLNRELYIHLEGQYCRYYTLEVLPEEFEFKILSLTEEQFDAFLKQKRKAMR